MGLVSTTQMPRLLAAHFATCSPQIIPQAYLNACCSAASQQNIKTYMDLQFHFLFKQFFKKTLTRLRNNPYNQFWRLPFFQTLGFARSAFRVFSFFDSHVILKATTTTTIFK